MNGLTALDIMVLLSLGAGAVFGLSRGFLVEIFSLAAWVAGVVAVKFFHAPVAAALTGPIGTSGGATVLAVALLFGVAFLVVRSIGGGVGRRAKASILGPVDRALGLGFGLFKGLMAATLAFLMMSLVNDTVYGGAAQRPAWMTKSHSYELLRASSAALVDFVAARRRSV